MQQAFAQPARNRALYTGACLLALASFIELCHLGAASASAGQRVQAIEAASDACLAAAHEAVKQKGLALLPRTQVSVTLVSGPIQQSDGASSCRAFANVRPPEFRSRGKV